MNLLKNEIKRALSDPHKSWVEVPMGVLKERYVDWENRVIIPSDIHPTPDDKAVWERNPVSGHEYISGYEGSGYSVQGIKFKSLEKAQEQADFQNKFRFPIKISEREYQKALKEGRVQSDNS